MTLDIHLGAGAHLVFNTPILILDKGAVASELNQGLRRAILEKERESKGRTISNVGGWQSAADVLEWPIKEIAVFKGWLREAVEQICNLPQPERVEVDFEAYAWANVNRDGDYNSAHNHDVAHWAVVYYVSRGQPLTGRLNGQLEIRDPRFSASADKYPGFTFGQGLILDPAPGRFLLFPAWLEHLVHPFHGQGERISISANVTMKNVATKAPAVSF